MDQNLNTPASDFNDDDLSWLASMVTTNEPTESKTLRNLRRAMADAEIKMGRLAPDPKDVVAWAVPFTGFQFRKDAAGHMYVSTKDEQLDAQEAFEAAKEEYEKALQAVHAQMEVEAAEARDAAIRRAAYEAGSEDEHLKVFAALARQFPDLASKINARGVKKSALVATLKDRIQLLQAQLKNAEGDVADLTILNFVPRD